jgi:hypothetical protein
VFCCVICNEYIYIFVVLLQIKPCICVPVSWSTVLGLRSWSSYDVVTFAICALQVEKCSSASTHCSSQIERMFMEEERYFPCFCDTDLPKATAHLLSSVLTVLTSRHPHRSCTERRRNCPSNVSRYDNVGRKMCRVQYYSLHTSGNFGVKTWPPIARR